MSPIPVHADTYMATVVFASDGTLDAKHWSNTFFFKDDGATPLSFSAAADAVKVLLDKFYGAINSPGTVRITNYMGDQVSLADSRIKVYDLNDPAPRIPEVRTVSFGTVPSGTRLPSECAAVLSYRSGAATVGGGSLDPRARGRLFIGPLSSIVMQDASQPDTILTQTFVNALVGAGDYLRDQTDNDLTWVQYSRLNDALANVTGGFVDNAFDTQRRRGSPASLRTGF